MAAALAALSLATCGQTPVFAGTLDARQRELIQRIETNARAQGVELDSTKADLAGVHLALLDAQTEIKAAADERAAMQRNAARLTAERDTLGIKLDACRASRRRWALAAFLFALALPYVLRFAVRYFGLALKYGPWLAAI